MCLVVGDPTGSLVATSTAAAEIDAPAFRGFVAEDVDLDLDLDGLHTIPVAGRSRRQCTSDGDHRIKPFTGGRPGDRRTEVCRDRIAGDS